MLVAAIAVRRGWVLAWCCLAGLAGCADASGGSSSIEERPRDVPARALSSSQWTTVARVGGTPSDSILQGPMRPVADEAGVYVLDFYQKNVQRYDHAGRLLWTYGRPGAGPDELAEPRDLKSDAAGRAWVLDPGNSRITIIDRNGAAVRRISLGDAGHTPQALIPMPGDEAMLVVPDPAAPFVRIGPDGTVRERMAFPWPGFAKLEYLATQLAAGVDAKSGRWIAAFQAGDGFFAYEASRWTGYRGWFVEEVAFPKILTTTSGGTVRTRAAQRPVGAAKSITLSPERLYVLFSGSTEYRNRIVDTYSLADGSYTGSVLLPHRVGEISWYDGGLYVVRDEPYPELALWRPQGAELR